VDAAATLINPDRPSSIVQIEHKEIEDRVASLPGRSIHDLVNTQPGWLYEGMQYYTPEDRKYQTQFVVDGMLLTGNRLPSQGTPKLNGTRWFSKRQDNAKPVTTSFCVL